MLRVTDIPYTRHDTTIKTDLKMSKQETERSLTARGYNRIPTEYDNDTNFEVWESYGHTVGVTKDGKANGLPLSTWIDVQYKKLSEKS